MVPHYKAMPGHPVLHSCLGMPVAVIEGSLLDAVLPRLPPLIPARTSSACGLSHWLLVIPATVAPSSPGQSLILKKNVPMSCSLASRSLKVVAPSIWISGILLPHSENTSSWAADPGTFPGHSWWSTRFIGTTAAPSGVHRAKSWPCCQSTSWFLDRNQLKRKTMS